MKKRKAIPAALICLAIAAALILPPGVSQSAQASTSLPGIEQIKQSSETFRILEIVPEAGTGSIGWYVPGQEPGANWAQDLLSTLPEAERTDTANAWLASLESDGLLGAAGTPLFKTGDYAEYAPWEAGNGPDGLNTLTLSAVETYENVAGAFTAAGSGGEYRADNSYSVSAGGAGGNYDQDIKTLAPLAAAYAGGTHYYCTLGVFSPLTAFDDVQDGLLIYRVVVYKDSDGNGLMDDPYDLAIDTADSNAIVPADRITSENASLLTYLSFQGCMGSSSLTGLNLLATYYTVPFTVSTVYNDAAPQYEAAANGFVRVGDGRGHFDAVTLSYTYVGLGSPGAAYRYSPDGSGSYTVKTKTVFYSGGFTNNNWFLKYVFNWESGEPAPAITVRSLRPGAVSVSDVEQADLIVLSAGRSAAVPYSAGNDISAEVGAAIASAGGAKVPVIVASALRSLDTLSIGALAAGLTSGGASDFVAKNIFCLSTALATKDFNVEIAGDHTSADDPFYPVWYEINYENFLRMQNDADGVTLPETVSIATGIRYIVNYGGQRVITNKTAIRVLELQPGAGSHLTQAAVSGWTGVPSGKITIDTMSTNEFIGKIDDLVETYDLVYIGSDLTGFATTGSGSSLKTNYTDNAMDGLIYSGAGDLYVSGYALTGLLDRDYASTSSGGNRLINYNDTSRTFRLSGNDITPAKISELLDFAAAGYPVVISDSLISGTPGRDAFSFRAVLSASDGTMTASAEAVDGTIPYGITKTYNWYLAGTGLVSSAGASYTPKTAGTYYCTVTIGGQTAASNTADVAITQQPCAVTPASPSAAAPGYYPGASQTYTVKITRTTNQGTYTYSIGVTPSAAGVTYQWYQWVGTSIWQQVPGATASSYSTTNANYYYCLVTINGSSCPSQYANPYGYESNTQNAQYTITSSIAFNAGVSSVSTLTNATLTAAWDPAVGASSNRSVAWYRLNLSGGYDTAVGSSYATTQTSGTYYCILTVTNGSGWNQQSYSARSNNYTVGNGTAAAISVRGDYGAAVDVPAVAPDYDVSTQTVDSCSNLYTFMSAVAHYANTFTETGASENSGTLVQYLNLSKPTIDFSESADGTPAYPVEYTGPDGPSLADRALVYRFTIRNETDVTPADTRYYCNFYIDMNADGRYDYTEQLADISITDGAGNVIRTGALKAGVEYTVTRTMPDEYVGIIPWQLEVAKTTQARVHASAHGYTHISGTPKTIYILQVLNGNGTSGLNLAQNATYAGLFQQVRDDFNLDIDTVSATGLNGNGPWSVTRTVNGQTVTTSYASRGDYLNAYDMLILGFADCYGELNKAAADAVVDFIHNPSGKAVLFTHDTTSIVNLPVNNYPATGNHTLTQSTQWGYYFNTILRDAVGLDRYGVTNPEYGVTTYSPNKETENTDGINVAAGALETQDADALTDAGYSVAWAPVSRADAGTPDASTVPEVQGVTSYTLKRYRNNTDNGTTKTQYVSQVNEGQITTYPFELNLKGFGNTDNTAATMKIAETHEQYYQLNMNPNDIVVWYCLAGGSYDALPNDVMNAYYIYSVGNVTYSGAGHSGNSVTTDEAKLFINTMIAAYQTATTPPAVSFIDPADPTGKTEQSDKFYAGDDAGLLAADPNADADTAVYFTVTDPSLGAGKVITAEFSYAGGETQAAAALPIYVKGGAETPINFDLSGHAVNYTLSGGTTYYVYPSAEMLACIAENNYADLTVTVRSSLLPGQPALAVIRLHKLGLFPLD